MDLLLEEFVNLMRELNSSLPLIISGIDDASHSYFNLKIGDEKLDTACRNACKLFSNLDGTPNYENIEKAKEHGIRCLFIELNPELTEIFGWICYVQLNDGPILIVEESDAISS